MYANKPCHIIERRAGCLLFNIYFTAIDRVNTQLRVTYYYY